MWSINCGFNWEQFTFIVQSTHGRTDTATCTLGTITPTHTNYMHKRWAIAKPGVCISCTPKI